MRKRIEAVIHGRVQGVFFRDSVRRHARRLGLFGTVENRGDGSVFVVAEGEEARLQELLAYLKQGPPLAKVLAVETVSKEYSGEFDGFTIVFRSFLDRF